MKRLDFLRNLPRSEGGSIKPGRLDVKGFGGVRTFQSIQFDNGRDGRQSKLH